MLSILSDLRKISLIKDAQEIVLDEALQAEIKKTPNGAIRLEKAIAHSKRVRVIRLEYLSNGHRVIGFIVQPRTIRGRLPCIISNRGGSGDFGMITRDRLFLHHARMAEWGYIVIASQYSGNDGGEGEDELGGSDLEDVLVLHKILKQHPNADIKRIGMYGASRGGMMTYLCLARVKWIKAAVVVAGLADLFRQIELRPNMKENAKKFFGGTKQGMIDRSAVRWVDRFTKKTPILLIHGTADWRVSPLDTLDMSREMLRLHVPHRLVLLEGADHGINEFRGLRYDMTQKWFDRYVRDGEKLRNLKLHGE